jgi:hypothetical protein
MMSIGISVFVVIIAALNLLTLTESKGIEQNAKYGVVWCNGTNDNSCMAIH